MQVVVLTASTLAEAMRVDAVCRDNGVAFIRAETRGVFASVFTDFGPAFTVLDTDGVYSYLMVDIGMLWCHIMTAAN